MCSAKLVLWDTECKKSEKGYGNVIDITLSYDSAEASCYVALSDLQISFGRI